MAKFDAGLAVEALEWDFTAFGGGEGVTPEPSTGRLNLFFANMKSMLRDVQALQSAAKGIDIEGMDEEQIAEAMSKVDEASEGAARYQAKTVEFLSELCGAERADPTEDEPQGPILRDTGSPSVNDLEKLPYRALQAFSTWLIGEVRPKGTPASRPSPRDHLRSGS